MGVMKWPRLYKRIETGKVQFWDIWVEDILEGSAIVTEYGVLNGKVQQARDVIAQGKNLGKANETTPRTQAELEAMAKHEKQRKSKGYVTTAIVALFGGRDALVQGGVDPMLAHKYRDHGEKVKWPAFVQPKLDGIRCIAVVKDGACTLWSRTRKPITGVPHIARAVEEACRQAEVQDIVLDGECYNHRLKSGFERIVSLVRQEVPQPGHEEVEYHVYDIVSQSPFQERNARVLRFIPCESDSCLKYVNTWSVQTEDEMMERFVNFLDKGYEGCVVRWSNAPYEHKRSKSLLKVKEMEDAEFEVAAVMEGRGKMAGKAVFGCKVDPSKATVYANGAFDILDENQFAVKMKGSLDNLVQYVQDPSLAVGKKLTVQYQNMTAAGKPRFPVGLRLRAEGV